MNKALRANRLIILARHAVTPANQAKYEGSAESLVQGLSPDMLIDEEKGIVQSHALGFALGRFVTANNLRVIETHASKTVRTITTRDLALQHVQGFNPLDPTEELWEQRKGNLENMLRSEAYPDKATRHKAANLWNFRHGTRKSGGETPREAGQRWLAWFNRVTRQENFQPAAKPDLPTPTLLVFGHNLVTACGVTLLTHGGEEPLPPISDRQFKVDNATALLLAENDSQWSVLPEKLKPSPAEWASAQDYVARLNSAD